MAIAAGTFAATAVASSTTRLSTTTIRSVEQSTSTAVEGIAVIRRGTTTTSTASKVSSAQPSAGSSTVAAPVIAVTTAAPSTTAVPAPPPLPALVYQSASEFGLVAAGIAQRAASADPNFAGAWIDGANILHLASAGDPTTLIGIAAQSGISTAVEARPTPRTRLLEVRNDIAARAYELAGDGLSLVAVSIADAPNAVRVTGQIIDPASQDRLRAHYPDVAIEVHAILDGAVAVRGNPRSSATLGLHGGMVISPAARPSFRCVAGFPVATSRGPGVLTAGHCGLAGERFLLGNGPGTAALGTVAARVNDGPNVASWSGQRVTATDTELIDTATNADDVLFDDRSLPIRGVLTNPVVGQVIYAALGRSGSTTPGRVTEVDVITIGSPNGEMPTTTHNIGISNCGAPGDSGSPVVAPDSSGHVRAIGLVIAAPDSQCDPNALATEHESEQYVSLLQPSLDALGAHIVERP